MEEILIYPKNATIYQGVSNSKLTSRWYTDHIGYASSYALKNINSVIKIYSTNKYLKLLNLETVKLTSLSNKKDIIIKSKDNKKQLKISLRDLYKIIFGKGCKKTPQIKTEKDIEELQKSNSKFKDTQYYLIYQIFLILGNQNQFIENLRTIIHNKNRITNIKKTKDFNRISRIKTDILFLNNLKKKFRNIDGYYTPDFKSDYHNFIDFGYYYQKAEIALFKNNKLKLLLMIKNPKLIYNLFIKEKKN
jgi:hypothetical protein